MSNVGLAIPGLKSCVLLLNANKDGDYVVKARINLKRSAT